MCVGKAVTLFCCLLPVSVKTCAGDLLAATETYNRCLILQPGFASAYSNLALVLIQQGELDAAAAMLDKAIEVGLLRLVHAVLRQCCAVLTPRVRARVQLDPELCSARSNRAKLQALITRRAKSRSRSASMLSSPPPLIDAASIGAGAGAGAGSGLGLGVSVSTLRSILPGLNRMPASAAAAVPVSLAAAPQHGVKRKATEQPSGPGAGAQSPAKSRKL